MKLSSEVADLHDELPLDKRVDILVCTLEKLRVQTPTLENSGEPLTDRRRLVA